MLLSFFLLFPIGFQREDCGHKRRDNEEEKGGKVAGRYDFCTQRVVANSLEMAIPNCKNLGREIMLRHCQKQVLILDLVLELQEEDKAKLVQETGLQLKQINNWFINQRKRNWNSNSSTSSTLTKNKRKR